MINPQDDGEVICPLVIRRIGKLGGNVEWSDAQPWRCVIDFRLGEDAGRSSVAIRATGQVMESDIIVPIMSASKFKKNSKKAGCSIKAVHKHGDIPERHFHVEGCHYSKLLDAISEIQ